MIEIFVSRPNWVPSGLEKHLPEFYDCLENLGFKPKTIGTNVVPMASPFEEVVNLMERCQCTIVLGMPQIFVDTGRIKKDEITTKVMLPTEWNQIEATALIMLKKPTLMLLHKSVIARGVFERGAANVFVHEFDCSYAGWSKKLIPNLEALKERVSGLAAKNS
jgi:hypothetical protein